MKPLARTSGLLIRELPEETLVYDLQRHQAHCLNGSAGRVFRLCDGTRTRAGIAAALEQGSDDEREAIVRLALAQLGDASLLAPAAAPAEPSRRDLMRRVGTALLLPAIASLLAPTPAQAASGCWLNVDCGSHQGEGCFCADTSECPTNTCVNVIDSGAPAIHCHPCDDF